MSHCDKTSTHSIWRPDKKRSRLDQKDQRDDASVHFHKAAPLPRGKTSRALEQPWGQPRCLKNLLGLGFDKVALAEIRANKPQTLPGEGPWDGLSHNFYWKAKTHVTATKPQLINRCWVKPLWTLSMTKHELLKRIEGKCWGILLSEKGRANYTV